MLFRSLKEWIDKEYEEGRQTSLSSREIEEKIDEIATVKLTKII